MLSIVAEAGGDEALSRSSNQTSPVRDRRPSSGDEATSIRHTLERHAGNIQKTARALGLSRQALYRRMEKHGIARPARHRSASAGSD